MTQVADEVKPWPTWVRYQLIAVLAMLAIGGLVAMFTHGVQGGVARIVIATVLIPALVAPLQAWGRRRRAQRKADRTPH